jgi:hypothetical protein
VYISPIDRPERLYRRGREVIPQFDSAELLYMRYSADNFLEGQLLPSAIRSQLKQSVNRGSLSEPEDVLFSETGEYNGLGVVGFPVSSIPGRVEQRDGPSYSFFMRHEPEELNYSHSEIWSDQDPPTGDFRKPSKTVSTTFRIRLCQSIGTELIKIKAFR